MPVLDWLVRNVPSFQKGQRIHDEYRKPIENLPRNCGNEEAVAFLSSEYCIKNRKIGSNLKQF
jgi:hypothetical protein